MTLDSVEFKKGFLEIQKEAGFGDDMGAAWDGLKRGTQNTNGLAHPLNWLSNAYQGAKAGYSGKVMNEQTAGLQGQGVQFDKDEYGRLKGLNTQGTMKNMWNRATNGNGFSGLMENTGHLLNQYKWPLLGGAAGLFLLKRLMDRPRVQHTHPMAYSPMMMAPQALEKGASFLPSPYQLPRTAMEMYNNGLSLGGDDNNQVGQAPAQQQPYNPTFSSDNPRLKKLLHDPRMRDYLTSLVQQMDTSRSSNQTV